MSPGLLAAIIVTGSLLFTGILIFAISSAVRSSIRRSIALVESEGIVLDSGRVHLKFRLRGFHAPGVHIGYGVRAGAGRLVLTRRRLCTIPISRKFASVSDIALDDLSQFQVGMGEGGLLLRTNDPPDARGSVDIIASVPNVETWVEALIEAGALPLDE